MKHHRIKRITRELAGIGREKVIVAKKYSYTWLAWVAVDKRGSLVEISKQSIAEVRK